MPIRGGSPVPGAFGAGWGEPRNGGIFDSESEAFRLSFVPIPSFSKKKTAVTEIKIARRKFFRIRYFCFKARFIPF